MNPISIREFAASYQTSRILLTGFELDIFSNLGESGSTAGQVASNLDLNLHGCERLLNALTSLGFLTKQRGLFFNTHSSYTYLSKQSPEYMGGLLHSNHLWKTWSNLTQVVRTGKSANPSEINDRGEDWLFPFINAMHDRAKRQAPAQLSIIDLSEVKSILDVGGGSGAYTMEFLKRKPQLRAAVFDLPNVVPITREFIDREGFSGRIDIFSGDYTTDELPDGFDLIFLSAIIHSNSLAVNSVLIKKCYASLNRNGRIIIQDWIMNDDRTLPLSGAIFAINMLVGTGAGDTFSDSEVTEMLTQAGFGNISRKEFESGPAHYCPAPS